MHAYIYSHTSAQNRKQAIERSLKEQRVSTFDRIYIDSVDGSSIGIAEIRNFTQTLYLAPSGGSFSAGIIYQGELLTIPAQQALLKTLEEPPAHVLIYISIENPDALLPTIVSRCQCIRIFTETQIVQSEKDSHLSLMQRLVSEPISEKIKDLQLLGNSKEEMLVWIDQAIITLRELLLTRRQHNTATKSSNTKPLHKLLKARQLAKFNIHPQTLIEDVFIS